MPGPATRSLLGLFRGQPLVTQGITIVCLLVFALMVASGRRLPVLPELGFGESFTPYTLVRFGGLVTIPGLPFEPWRVISAIFVHASALHVGMNLWALMSLSLALETRFGPARAFLIFLLSGVGGFLLSSLWAYNNTCGASGGLFGLLGAFIGVLVTRKHPGWKDIVKQQLIYAAILALLFRVNTTAHIGGFVVGLALGFLLERERPRPAASAIFGVLAVLGALASLGAIGASFASPLTRIVAAAAAEE
jgi:membrane associated rhomboid family serine protease